MPYRIVPPKDLHKIKPHEYRYYLYDEEEAQGHLQRQTVEAPLGVRNGVKFGHTIPHYDYAGCYALVYSDSWVIDPVRYRRAVAAARTFLVTSETNEKEGKGSGP